MLKSISPILAVAWIFASCGTSKKLESANAEISRLNNEVLQLTNQRTENEKSILELKQANEVNSKDAADCRAAKELARQRKEQLDKELAARGTSVEELKNKAAEAVRKFEEVGCDVTYENGRFHIIVPDEFNFQPGSVSVSPKGRKALNVVAQVLYDNPGISAVIVGNTDNVAGKNDNWTVSTERANAVVRVLENAYNINPKRLTAAGSGMFHPIASNDTEEGRDKNRRIEIYLNPHIERIWNLLDK